MAFMNKKVTFHLRPDIDHSQLRTGNHVFIGDQVKIMEGAESGYIDLGERVELHRELTLHTGQGGNIIIGPRSSVHAGCYLIAYKGSIRIGADVQIASNAAFYPYNHGFAPGAIIGQQPLTSRGDIVLEDDVNIGFGVVVLDGVTIGKGAAVGAWKLGRAKYSTRSDRHGCLPHECLECARSSKDGTAKRRITHIAHESSVAPNPARAKLSGTSGTPPVFSVKD